MKTLVLSCCTVVCFGLAVACSSSGGGDGDGGSGGGGGDVSGGGGGGEASGGSAGGGGAGGKASGGAGGNAAGGAAGQSAGGAGGMAGRGGSAGGGAGGQAMGTGGAAMGGAAGASATGGAPGNPNFGGAAFVAVGAGKTALSTDGKVWTAYPDGMTPNNLEIVNACFGNKIIMALNHMSNATVKQGVWTSTNGHNFTRVYPADAQDGLPGEGCAYGKGLFAVGNRYSVDDGKTWTNATSDGGVGNRGVAFGNGVFVGAGDGNIDWSADGKTWSKGTVDGGGAVVGLSYVVFGGSKFVTVPYNNANPCFESADGKVWKRTKSALPTQSESHDVGVALKKIFVVTNAAIYWLPDASAPGTQDWTKSTTNFDEGAIGGTDTLAVSPKHWSTDGMTWTPSTTPIPQGYSIRRIITVN